MYVCVCVWLAYEALVRLEELHQARVSYKSARVTESVANFNVYGQLLNSR